jgi:hypothetical protein
MNKIQLLLCACLVSIGTFINAQINTPAASTSAKFEQRVGLTDIKVEYSRPSAKGRKIFGTGGIITNDSLWRAGANQATKISFSDDVAVEGKSLKKGDYAILIKPVAVGPWTVNFYKYETGNWGSYVKKAPDAAVMVAPKMLTNNVESFSMGINNIENTKATLLIEWEKTQLPINFSVEVDKVVMAAIDKVMAGPTGGDYYNAGSYFHDAKKDLNKALEWVQKANAIDKDRFWQLRKESLILADLGRYKEAIAVATKSKELATTANNQDYIKMNVESIAMWLKK